MRLIKLLVGMLLISAITTGATAADVLQANADHNIVWDDVYSGEIDYIYCSWDYLSGRPHDAWKVQIPLYYVYVLDNWDGGSMWTEPGYYTWFIVDEVEAGDSSPYDSYYDLPAPWIKVKYSSDSTVTVTYTCKASLWDRLIDIWNIPIFYKAVEATSSFTLTIHPQGVLFSSKSNSDKKVERSAKIINIKDFSQYKELALTQGKMIAIKALKENNNKKVDAITLEYNNGKWIVKGYRLKGNCFDKLVFEYVQ